MGRSEFFRDFILKFYSQQIGIVQILADAQTAWDAIINAQVAESEAISAAKGKVIG